MNYKNFDYFKKQTNYLYGNLFHKKLEIYHVHKNNEILYFSVLDIDIINPNGEFLLIHKNEEIAINCSINLENQQIIFDLSQISNISKGDWKIVYKSNEILYYFHTIKEEIITKKNSPVGGLIDNKYSSVLIYIDSAHHFLSLKINKKEEIIKQFSHLDMLREMKQKRNLNIQSLRVAEECMVIEIPKEEFEYKYNPKFFVRKRKESNKFYLNTVIISSDINVKISIDLHQLFDEFLKNTRIDLFYEERIGEHIVERRISYLFKSSIENKQRYYSYVFKNDDFGLIPYITKDHEVSIYISSRSRLLNETFLGRVTLENINHSSKGILTGVIKLETKEIHKAIFIILKHRKSLIDDAIRIPVKRIKDSNKYSFAIDLKSIDFTQFYWDFFLRVKNEDDMDIDLRIKNDNVKIKAFLQLYEKKYTYFYPDQQYKIYPYITRSEELSLNYRIHGKYEEPSYKKNEKIAYVLYLLLGLFYKNKKIWIIHEKYSQTAQDNSYYFFKYCYENHYDKPAYFVITKDSMDNKYLEPYKDRVLYFMSTKHLFYLLNAKKIISSEAKGHGYAWRVSHGLIKPALDQKRYIFLQHGVLGLKQIDNTFKANGVNHADLFITSSDFEKEIVKKNFGYKDSQIIVSGLSRWDAPKNKLENKRRSIFFMPTWRNWLEEVNEDAFLKSDYYKEYSAFLQSEKLARILNEYQVELNFYLHPKFMPYVHLFNTMNSKINIVKFGDKTINQLMQECTLLITDYSSIAWEAYYHDKMVLFYQFDRDKYLNLQGSYMDLETELFGQCALNSVDLIKLINERLSNSSVEYKSYFNNKKRYFNYVDNQNSKRIYYAILEKEKNLIIKNAIIQRLKNSIILRTVWKKYKSKMVVRLIRAHIIEHIVKDDNLEL